MVMITQRICCGKNEVCEMNSDLLIACIIAGVFFLTMIGIFVEGFIREWIAEERMRKSYAGKIDKLMSENWNI